MTLAEGSQLGSFEVTGQLGAGGMGEVYRATDTRLGREVAIKTLPVALAEDKDRLARFEREAKLLASLNHAHIASVYSLDEHDGTLYIAMELVEGETLEEKLKNGALPVGDALQIALQISLALEAAHEKGVVHRDLKPANVMITNDGVVKVLDFGLAKAFMGEVNEASPAHSPALSIAMTQAGLVLGTAGYMSPEQASGQGSDQRADVWSFGVVTYEMLTGMPLFSGESVPHILADVLRADPDWERLPTDLHPRIRQMLERCLAKKPRNRYHAIADARVDLEAALADPRGVSVAPALTSGAAAQRPVWPRMAASIVASLAFAAVVALVLWPRPEADAPQPLNRFEHDVPVEQTFFNIGRSVIGVSPDGRHFVTTSDDGLVLRRMSELDGVLIQGSAGEDVRSPFVSPDGQWIAYEGDSDLKRIAISGGAPVVVASGTQLLWGASWATDGTIFLGTGEGIARVPSTGGVPELVVPALEGEQLYGPELLPDGDTLLFTASQSANWDTAEIAVVSLSTGERKTVFRGGSDARYLPTGHLVYAFDDDLFAVAFDSEMLEVAGGPVSVVQNVARAPFGTPAANYGIADNGTLVYVSGNLGELAGFTAIWVDRNGQAMPAGIPQCLCLDHALSPDGNRVALTIFDVNRGESDIWIWSFTAQTMTRLTLEEQNQFSAVWTDEGRGVAYWSDPASMLQRAADNTGTVSTLIGDSTVALFPTDVDGDGRILLSTSAGDLMVFDPGSDDDPTLLLSGDFAEDYISLSPDGRWIAYQSNETGIMEIYVRPYPDVDAGRWQVSNGGGTQPIWAPDSGSLFFLGPGQMMEAVVESGDDAAAFVWQTPRALFALEEYVINTGGRRNYDIAIDGERFLMFRDDAGQALALGSEVVIVQHWVDELKRLVPTN